MPSASIKGVIKRSSSKLGAGKGSIAHIGTTPSKFRIDFFIQYVDGVRSDDAVCVVWERRDTLLATKAVMVKDAKAVFRENLSMQVTLFRRDGGGGDGPKFDEKKAKFAVKKNDADGKTLAKIHLNLADYVQGSTGTTFADIKLSNGSVMASKIEATLLSSGKGKGGGDGASSKMSAMTTGSGGLNDADSSIGDDDSIFDDGDLDDLNDLETTRAPGGKSGTVPTSPPASARGAASPSLSSLVSSSAADPSASKKEEKKEEKKEKKKAVKAAKESSKQASKEAKGAAGGSDSGDGPAKSSSKRILAKISKKVEKTGSSVGIEKKAKKAAAAAAAAAAASDGGSAHPPGSSSESLRPAAERDSAPLVAELRKRVAALEKSNGRLQLDLKEANDEMDALQAELEAATSSEVSSSKAAGEAKKQKDTIKALQREVHTLKLENTGLLEELDEHTGQDDESSSTSIVERLNQKNAQLTSEIQDLTQKLGREPEFLKVVEQLKVIKVQLATAIEDKEQALFLLKQSGRGMQSAASFTAVGTPLSQSSSQYSIGGAV